MTRIRLESVHPIVVAVALLAFGIVAPGAAVAQPSTGYECILDSEDNGVADDPDLDESPGDTDAGANANTTASNLACGQNAYAGPDGTNTAIGSGATAGMGTATESQNTALGEGALAGVGDDNQQNTAIGEDAHAGVSGNGSSTNSAVGNGAMAGIGDASSDNAAFGGGTQSGVGTDSDFNSAFGPASGAGIGDDADRNTAVGSNTTAGLGNGSDSNTAVGDSARAGIGDDANDNVAIGESADAGVGDGKSGNLALGPDASANGALSDGFDDATAVGSSAAADFDRSAAFGADAVATRANQMVYGTDTETHTMPGITSAASRSAQSGPLELVTSDAMGNLATDGGEWFGRVRANADDIDDNSEGIAMAMSIQDPDLVGDERLGLKVGWGTFSGENAMGVAASGVLVPDIGAGIRLGLAGGAAFGLSRGGIGGRAGLQLSW